MKNKMPWANFFSASIFFTFLVLCTEKKSCSAHSSLSLLICGPCVACEEGGEEERKKKRNRRRRRRRRRGRGTGRWLAPGTCGAAFAAVAGAWAAARSVGSAGSDAPVALFVGAGVSLLLFLFFLELFRDPKPARSFLGIVHTAAPDGTPHGSALSRAVPRPAPDRLGIAIAHGVAASRFQLPAALYLPRSLSG